MSSTPKHCRTLFMLSCALAVARPAVAQIPGLPGIPGLGGLLGGAAIVYDPTAVAKLVEQIRSQLRQIAMQEQQLAEQILAMQKLGQPSWRQIDQALVQMDELMQHGEALAYSLRAIDGEFQTTFPGEAVYHDFPGEEARQVSRTLATLRGVLNAAHRASEEYSPGLTRLEEMKAQLGTIRGHEEALELNTTVSVYSAEELMLLRQAITAGTNAEAVYFADQVNRTAQEQATVRANLAALAEPGPEMVPYSLQIEP